MYGQVLKEEKKETTDEILSSSWLRPANLKVETETESVITDCNE